MKDLVIVIVIMGLLPSVVMSQAPPPRRDIVIDKQFGTIADIPLKKSETVGSVYVSEDWLKTDVFAKPGTVQANILKNVQVKLNLEENALELLFNSEIKILNAVQVDSFSWVLPAGTKERFVNVELFERNSSNQKGFGKIISEGKITLLGVDYVEIQRANYNPALAIGDTGDKIIKKTRFYLLANSKLVSANKRSAKELLNLKQENMAAFIKEKDIDITDPNGLKLLVDFYNTMTM